MKQEFKQPERRDNPESDPPIEPPVASVSQVDEESYDDLLDEIDGVLESNAEEFVRGFVQRGGE